MLAEKLVVLVFVKKWRPYRESNPGYLREREVS